MRHGGFLNMGNSRQRGENAIITRRSTLSRDNRGGRGRTSIKFVQDQINVMPTKIEKLQPLKIEHLELKMNT